MGTTHPLWRTLQRRDHALPDPLPGPPSPGPPSLGPPSLGPAPPRRIGRREVNQRGRRLMPWTLQGPFAPNPDCQVHRLVPPYVRIK